MSHNEITTSPPDQRDHQGSPLYTALARTTTRAITLYFSRPVRLFRPSKAVGIHFGDTPIDTALLSVPGISFHLLRVKFMAIPKHFVPPLLANAALGTVLWTTYTECSGYLESRLGAHSIFTVILSGATAGGVQAIVAAPVENVRRVIEGGTGKGWSHAWKEVFRGTQPTYITSRSEQIKDIRQVRLWMKDVGEMAGRGWAGWRWGFGKDVCGFAAFFAVFEITRKVGGEVKFMTHHALQRLQSGNQALYNSPLVRFTHAFTLVCGGMMAGLAYDVLCRPWDVAHRAITLGKSTISHLGTRQSSFSILRQKLQEDGITSFFHEHSPRCTEHPTLRSNLPWRISSALRTLGRVGPWGVAFLVWESFGPGSD